MTSSAHPLAAATPPPAVLTRETTRPGWPWYRGEPWLAINLSAFVPLGTALALPEWTHIPLLGASAMLAALSIVLLIRQGLFRANEPRRGPPRRR